MFCMSQLYHYINLGVADLHKEPNEMSEVVNQAIYGSRVQILKKEQSWMLIELTDKYQGWVKRDSLISLSQEYASMRTVGAVSTMWTYIYHSSDTSSYPPAIAIPYNAKIEVLSSENEFLERWIRVRMIDRRELYAQSADFSFSKNNISLEEVVQESKKFIGLPYRWGGNSGFGFDCSGLIQTLFFRAGILLPRDSKDQARDPRLKKIEKMELRQGDLVFFGKQPERINHVGLFIGNQCFIHAVTTNEVGPHVVQISNLDDAEWSRKFICARRWAGDGRDAP